MKPNQTEINNMEKTQIRISANGDTIKVGKYQIDKAIAQHVVEVAHSSKAMGIFGEPGIGKSFFAQKILPDLLYAEFRKEYVVIYCQLGMFRNIEDAFVSPMIRSDGSTYWAKSPQVKAIEVAKEENIPILYVADECTRMTAQQQQYLLSMCEVEDDRKRIMIQQLGEEIYFTENSKIILIGNDSGDGVNEIIEPLHSRIAAISWKRPSKELIIDMVWTQLNGKNVIANSNIEGLNLEKRKLSRNDVARVVKALEKQKGLNLDLRDYYEIFHYASRSPYAVQRILTFLKGLPNIDSEAFQYDEIHLKWELENIFDGGVYGF